MSDGQCVRHPGMPSVRNVSDMRPSIRAKIINAIFGSPNVLTANGIYSKVEPAQTGHGNGDDLKCRHFHYLDEDALDRFGLPRIWLVDPKEAGSNTQAVFSYVFPNSEDAGGKQALDLAYRFFSSAFSSNNMDEDGRKELFYISEILFLHSYARGNTEAAFRLGDIYHYDLCKGKYYFSALEARAMHSHLARRAFTDKDLLSRAWLYYAGSARRQYANAFIELGDIQRTSKDPENAASAFRKYLKAFSIVLDIEGGLSYDDIGEIAAHMKGEPMDSLNEYRRYVFSRASLRLAECFEHSRGCRRDIRLARLLYSLARTGFGHSFDSGAWHVKGEMLRSSYGARRCSQEIEYEDI